MGGCYVDQLQLYGITHANMVKPFKYLWRRLENVVVAEEVKGECVHV